VIRADKTVEYFGGEKKTKLNDSRQGNFMINSPERSVKDESLRTPEKGGHYQPPSSRSNRGVDGVYRDFQKLIDTKPKRGDSREYERDHSNDLSVKPGISIKVASIRDSFEEPSLPERKPAIERKKGPVMEEEKTSYLVESRHRRGGSQYDDDSSNNLVRLIKLL
jgi:hypothetical protein